MGARSTWGVSELVDLEAQIFQDREQALDELRARDATLGLELRGAAESRDTLLARWIHAIREQSDADLPGRDLEHAYARVNAILVLGFLVIGFSSAWGILQLSGGHPINVLVVLGVFVFAQLLAAIVTVSSIVLARLVPGFFENRPLVVLLRALVAWLWRVARKRFSRPNQLGPILGWLRARRSLYRDIERQLLFLSLQKAGIAFNVGALLAFIAAVTFTDLSFGWSTTLRIGADELYRLCAIVAAPWALWFESATASMELIRATQYSHLEGTYIEAAAQATRDLTLYGQWWPFLVAAIVTYGLLPRLGLAAIGKWTHLRTLKGLPPDTPEIQRLVFRLTAPSVQRVHTADPGNVTPLGAGYDPVARLPRPTAGLALCTRWRDAEFSPAEFDALLSERYGLRMEGDLGSAGGHDYEDDQAFLTRVSESGPLPVFVVAEPWAAPDRAFRRFLDQLRAEAGEERWVNVVLTEGDHAAESAIWAGYLAELADPYLAFDREGMGIAEGSE